MFLAGAFNELILQYFYRHLPLYLALILLFVTGVAFGAVATGQLSPLQKTDLTNYLGTMYTSIAEDSQSTLPKGEVFYQSVVDNVVKTTGLFFLLGLTIIGSPLILVIVFIRGFVLGFTVGFMMQEAMLKGLLLSATSILPHNLVVIPAILIGAGGSLSFAASASKALLGLSKEGVSSQFVSTTFLSFCSALLLVMAALIETYVTPIFIHLSKGLFI